MKRFFIGGLVAASLMLAARRPRTTRSCRPVFKRPSGISETLEVSRREVAAVKDRLRDA